MRRPGQSVTEAPPTEAVETSEGLAAMAEQDTSLLTLVRTLLHPRTLPHVLMLVVSSSLLFLATEGGLTAFSAVAFVSLALAYATSGILSSVGSVRRWMALDPTEEVGGESEPSPGLGRRLLNWLKICLFPIVLACLWAAALFLLLGEDGALGDQLSTLPLVLSGLFVLWSIVQARSLSSWMSSVAAKRLPEPSPRSGGIAAHVVLHSVLLGGIILGLLSLFTMVAGEDASPAAVARGNAVFFGVFGLLMGVSFATTREQRRMASRHRSLHRFSGAWLLMSQFFVVWHALTVWRHTVMSPPPALLLVEELMLMVFTVIMAIWGLTSKSVKSALGLVHDGNALPMGLAFGYAYAGSVAMLTGVLDDVRTVMMAGHAVVMCTLLWMQRSVLIRALGQHDAEVTIRRAVDAAAPSAAVSGRTETPVGEANEASESPTDRPDGGSGADKVPSEQTLVSVDWADDPVEVLADDVDWGSEANEG